VTTGKKPDAIIFDPATSRVFAFNGESDSATAIDAATGKVAGTVDLAVVYCELNRRACK